MLTFLFAIATLALPTSGRAGIGPQNLVLVVNSGSSASRTVANHYSMLRQIPSRNIIHLDSVPRKRRIDLATFRQTILQPLLAAIDRRQLGNQARIVAYSLDFPTEIGISPHCKQIEDPKLRKLMTPVASLTGLTFHFRHVIANSSGYLAPGSNLYSRRTFSRFFVNPFLDEEATAFHAAEAAAEAGHAAEAAAEFAQLFEVHPEQHPLAIRAAESYAASGDKVEAARWLRRAIDAGWSSARYLQKSENLVSLLQRPDLAEAVAQLDDRPIDLQPTVGFVGDRIYTPTGLAASSGPGVNYLLATVLGVGDERGMTVNEVVAHLQALEAVKNGQVQPAGKFLFCRSSDVRTTTRAKNFAPAVDLLQWLGQEVEIIDGKLPKGPQDCRGVMLGTASFRWKDSRCRLVSAALAENLTSFGGALDRAGQTKLTELLRAGAAMSSGTVTEPYAVQMKFPHPLMHGHYAAGASAIEAFYLSVATPYQLLIVGDPLCAPYARPPQVEVQISPRQRFGIEGLEIRLNPPSPEKNKVAADKGLPMPAVGAVEFYLDGHWMRREEPASSYWFGLRDVPPGSHELAVVCEANDLVAARRTFRHRLTIGSEPNIPTVEVVDGGPREETQAADARQAASPTVRLRVEGAEQIILKHHQVEVGRVSGQEGLVPLSDTTLGRGPVRLQAIAVQGGAEIAGESVVVEVP